MTDIAVDITPNSNHNSALLRVHNLKKYFPVKRGRFVKNNEFIQAVCGISFGVKKGKTLAIVGESGSGKTTVARIILRLEQADAGEVFFEGNNILKYDAGDVGRLRQEIQMIFQDPYSSLNPHKTVYKIIGEPLKIHKICSKQ